MKKNRQKILGIVIALYINFLVLFHKYKIAEKTCLTYKKFFPKKLLFYDYLANIYLKEKDLDSALEVYLKTLSLIDNIIIKMERLIKIMEISYKCKRYFLTIDMANSYFRIKPISILQNRIKSNLIDWVYWYLAYSYYSLGNYKEAITYFVKLLYYKKKEKHYYPLAYCHQRAGNYSEAVLYYKKALEYASVPDKKSEVYYHLGKCYEQMGKYKEAVNVYKEGLKLDPGNTDLKGALKEFEGEEWKIM